MTRARNTGYRSAGTMEFIFDKETQKFYFLEMDTRAQVEHPVIEMISGAGIVREQIRVAAGEPLSPSQSMVTLTGHAMECRTTAEAPERDFVPSPGMLRDWVIPEGRRIRVDTNCYTACFVPPYYDLADRRGDHGRKRPARRNRTHEVCASELCYGRH